MTVTTYDFESGTDGAAVTTADLGTGASIANSGGNPIYSGSAAAHGALGMACGTTGTSGSSYIKLPFTSAASAAFRFYLKVTATPTKTVSLVTIYDTTSAAVVGVNWTTANAIQWGGTNLSYKTSGALSTATLYRVEVVLTTGSSGSITVDVYAGDTTTLVGSSPYNTQTGVNLGTNQVASLQIGVASGDGTTFDYDDIAISPGATSEIGAYVPAVAPSTSLYLMTGGQWVQVTVAK